MITPSDLLNTLARRNLTLGSVESLTGGLFGATMCGVPGASKVFLGGLITYDSKEKVVLAGVSEETIDEFTVVSPNVAAEMAAGGCEKLGVDVCVSCTGNAGPTVQVEGEPVGRVYLGLCFQGNVWTIPLQFSGERNEIRDATVQAMIAFVASLFPEEKKETNSEPLAE